MFKKYFRIGAALLFSFLILFACTPASTSTPPTTTQPIVSPSAVSVTPTSTRPARPTREPSVTPSKPPLTTPAWFNEAILYEIFPRSFYDSNGDGIGDLKGITQKLDYLQALGVNALWLTPIFASPSYHGYDTTDYYKINPEFGTEAELVELVREAHRRHIRVLLDYVVAHTSDQHPFFKEAFGNPASKYAEWYLWNNPAHTEYETFFGVKELPRVNYDSADAQKYFIDVAKYWMQKTGDGDPKRGIDGYRADYVLNVPHAYWKKLRAEVKALNPEFLLLAEAWTGGLDIARYYENEFDATFDFPSYGDLEGSNDRVGDSMLLGGNSGSLLFGTLSAESRLFPPGAQSVHFLNNHDTDRVMSEVKGDRARAKLGATLLLTLPPTPMVYYGEEIGMTGTKAPAPDYDKTRREPMDWYAAESGAGMTNWYKPSGRNNQAGDGVSVEEEQGQADSLLEHYRALIKLRAGHSALRAGALEKLSLEGSSEALAFLRTDAQETLLVILNFGAKPASLTLDFSGTSLPDGIFRAMDLFGEKKFPDLESTTYTLDVEPTAAYVLQLMPRSQ